MIRHWTEFQGSPNGRERDAPRVTLNAKGMFLLNRKAFEALEAPAAVQLLFDENEKIVGLKPADIRRPNAFPIKQKDKYHNHRIQASPFCRHFHIRVERTTQFNEIDLDNEGVLTLSLRNTTTIGRVRGAPRVLVTRGS